MPCILLVLFFLFPRVVLVLAFFFTNFIERAYHGYLIPLLGFIFLPLTTLVYAWIVNAHLPVTGVYLLAIIVAVLIDAGSLGGGGYYRRSRS